MTKRAILYARVSSDEQADTGWSIESQVEAMREYAAQQGMIVTAEFREDFSGAKLQRPELELARDLMEQGQADVFMVYTADRLARNLAHSLLLREELLRAGIELHTVARGKSQDTPEGRMIENIEGTFAEYEREKIRERTSRGAKRKAKAGKWVGNGYPPFGYRKVGTLDQAHLVIDPGQAAVVRRIYQLYLGDLETAPIGTVAIANRLNADGVPPAGHPLRKHAAGWHQGVVYSMLTRRTYLGEFSYSAYVAHLPELALIDNETWEAAQRRRKLNADLSPRCKKYDYLLGGRIRCSCGVMMRGKEKRAGGHSYGSYVCGARSRYSSLIECREKPVKVPKADPRVWEWLYELLRDPERLEQGLNALEDERRALVAPKRVRLEVVKALVEREDRKLARLAADLGDLEPGPARDAVKAEIGNSGRTRTALEKERLTLADEVARIEFTPQQRKGIMMAAQAVARRVTSPTFAQKRELLDVLLVQAVVRTTPTGCRELYVTCAIPGYDVAVDICHISNISTASCTRCR